MARSDPSPAAPPALTVAVVVPDRPPYAMFDAVEVTAAGARLRGPLLLEVGERVRLRVARGDRSTEVSGRVSGVRREGHADPETEIAFDEGADGLRPLLG